MAINTPLGSLIAFAYGVDGVYRTLEGTSKLLDDRFDVVAKASTPVKRMPFGEIGPLNVMMQNLLMVEIARYLSRQLRRPVVDKTGLLGPHDLQMKYDATTMLRERLGMALAAEPSALPSLYNALQEQLGLKLEQQRVTIRALVVEHVEPPSEN